MNVTSYWKGKEGDRNLATMKILPDEKDPGVIRNQRLLHALFSLLSMTALTVARYISPRKRWTLGWQ